MDYSLTASCSVYELPDKCYLEWVAILGEVFSQNVQHPDHLREDQDSVSSFSESGQQLVQQHQLPAAPHYTL